MLDEFLITNREEIIARTRAKVENRRAPTATKVELENGVPLFLTQLIRMLQEARTDFADEEISSSATKHGEDMRRMGFTVGQVVQDYGGLCQAITELAIDTQKAISGADFKTLNGCLDNAIAAAVSEFGRRNEQLITDQGVEHLGALAHELRSALDTMALAFDAIRSGAVGPKGSTSDVVLGSLTRMYDLVHRSLADMRLKSRVKRRTPTLLAGLIDEVTTTAVIEAEHRGLGLTIEPVAGDVRIETDTELFVSALSNLLQNAFKFTPRGGHVAMTTRTTADRVRIEVEDECGGLPAATLADLVRMFEQRGADRSGSGLGLAISRQSVEESGGTIGVRDLPGKGCVFTVDVPRLK